MQDRTLVAIALSLAGLGLLALSALVLLAPIPAYTDVAGVGDKIVLSGRASAVRTSGSLTSFTVTYETTIDAVVFENLTIPECVIIHGSVDEYEGRRQIVASRIHSCNE